MFLTKEVEEIFEQIFGEKEVIFFGEGFGNKIQKVGNKYLNDNSFILFDIFIPQLNVFLQRKDIEDIAKSFNLQCVPIVGTGSLLDAVEYVKTKPMSQIGKKQAISEGIVCKPRIELQNRLNERVIVKIKHRDFN